MHEIRSEKDLTMKITGKNISFNKLPMLIPAKDIIDVCVVGPLTILLIMIISIVYIINDIIPHIHTDFPGYDAIKKLTIHKHFTIKPTNILQIVLYVLFEKLNKIILNIKLVLNIIIQYKTSLFKSATHSTQTKMQLNDNEVKLFQVTLIGVSHVYFSYAT